MVQMFAAIATKYGTFGPRRQGDPPINKGFGRFLSHKVLRLLGVSSFLKIARFSVLIHHVELTVKVPR
jgi:hypothetical protein